MHVKQAGVPGVRSVEQRCGKGPGRKAGLGRAAACKPRERMQVLNSLMHLMGGLSI